MENEVYEMFKHSDESLLRSYLENLMTYQYLKGNSIDKTEIQESVLDGLMKCICDPKITTLINSHYLFDFIQSEWTRISSGYQIKIALTCQTVFGRFKDELSDFLIAEIFGKFLHNRFSFEIICALAIDENISRMYIPYALRCLHMHANDVQVSDAAKVELSSLLRDQSLDVQTQALYEWQILEKTRDLKKWC